MAFLLPGGRKPPVSPTAMQSEDVSHYPPGGLPAGRNAVATLKPPDSDIVPIENVRAARGSPEVHNWRDYEAVARNIRKGLLAQLTPATAEKVAYKNSEELFGLD
jgi:hypothetical protein